MLQKSIVKYMVENASGDKGSIYNQILPSWHLDGDQNSIETSESGVFLYVPQKNIGRRKK